MRNQPRISVRQRLLRHTIAPSLWARFGPVLRRSSQTSLLSYGRLRTGCSPGISLLFRYVSVTASVLQGLGLTSPPLHRLSWFAHPCLKKPVSGGYMSRDIRDIYFVCELFSLDQTRPDQIRPGQGEKCYDCIVKNAFRGVCVRRRFLCCEARQNLGLTMGM